MHLKGVMCCRYEEQPVPSAAPAATDDAPFRTLSHVLEVHATVSIFTCRFTPLHFICWDEIDFLS